MSAHQRPHGEGDRSIVASWYRDAVHGNFEISGIRIFYLETDGVHVIHVVCHRELKGHGRSWKDALPLRVISAKGRVLHLLVNGGGDGEFLWAGDVGRGDLHRGNQDPTSSGI